MSYSISIAGIEFHITTPGGIRPSNKVKHFMLKSNDIRKPDIKLCITYQENISIPAHTVSLDEHIKWSGEDIDGSEITIYLSRKEQAHYCLKVNKDWSSAVMLANVKKRHICSQLQGPLGEILFRNCLLNHQGIVIHGAAIRCNNRGIIFSAPSGTGKTTQANLWRKYKGAKIINADRPAIRIIENTPYVYGTLWNDSLRECMNTNVRLDMIVVLEQSPVNEIIRLSEAEAVAKVMPRCFLPYFAGGIMNLALENLEKVIEVTPVYLLKCRPDKEAMELVSQCMEQVP